MHQGLQVFTRSSGASLHHTVCAESHLCFHNDTNIPTQDRPSPDAIFVALTAPKGHRRMEVQLTSSSRRANSHRGGQSITRLEVSTLLLRPVKPVTLVPDERWNSVQPETFQELESTFLQFTVVLPAWVCLPGEGAKAEASSPQISPVKASKTHNELHRELLLAHRR